MSCLTRVRNLAPSTPSMARWSNEAVIVIIGRIAISPFSTTGVSIVLPTAKMGRYIVWSNNRKLCRKQVHQNNHSFHCRLYINTLVRILYIRNFFQGNKKRSDFWKRAYGLLFFRLFHKCLHTDNAGRKSCCHRIYAIFLMHSILSVLYSLL